MRDRLPKLTIPYTGGSLRWQPAELVKTDSEGAGALVPRGLARDEVANRRRIARRAILIDRSRFSWRVRHCGRIGLVERREGAGIDPVVSERVGCEVDDEVRCRRHLLLRL